MTPLFEFKNNYAEYRQVRSIMQYGDYSECQSPQISVVLPVYNSPIYFRDALNSILNQNCLFTYEVIVVDNTPYDGEKNETLKYIESINPINVFYYRNEKNIGMCGNWNRGIELCRSDFITICHDDDMLMPSCLATLWKIHLEYPDKAIFPAHTEINENDHYPFYQDNSTANKPRGTQFIPYNKLDMFIENPSNGVGCLFRKSILIELGGYNNEYFPALDYALYIKYVFKYGGIFCRLPLSCYRKARGNTSFSVYHQYPVVMNYLWNSMTDEMIVPKPISQIIQKALSKNFTNAIEVVWGGGTSLYSFSIIDRIVFYFLNKRRKIRLLWWSIFACCS